MPEQVATVQGTSEASQPESIPTRPIGEQSPDVAPFLQTSAELHEKKLGHEHANARRAMYIAGAVVALGGVGGGAYYVSQQPVASQTEKVAKKTSSEADSTDTDAGSVEDLDDSASSADEVASSSQAQQQAAADKAAKVRAKKLAKVQADPDNKSPWFGMVTGDMPYDSGIMIYEIFPGYTASQSELEPEMIITEMDGEEIADTAAMKQFLTRHIVGDTITCTLKDGTKIKVKLTTPRSKINNVTYSEKIPAGNYRYSSGFSGASLGDMNEDKEMGFYVTGNTYDSGPVSGDIIFKVGKYFVSSNQDIENAFSHSGPGSTLTIKYFDSDNEIQTMSIDLS
ncbi:hypothetical protein [Periweissella cryptocerci]|nr:hypothetical protein [Periweissella cryptocerci]